MSEQSKSDALDKAVRVSLANGGHEKHEDTVKRAEAFDAFLTGK